MQNKTTTIGIVILCSILFFSSIIKAQSATNVHFNIEIIEGVTFIDPIDNDSNLDDPAAVFQIGDTLKVSISMLLADTIHTSKIHVKLGTTIGGEDFLNQTYLYNDIPLENSQASHRYKDMIVLGLGTYSNPGNLYGLLVIEDNNGNRSAPISCSLND